MRSKEVEEKIRVDIDIEKVKESLEIINNYAEDMKKNHQYMSNKEQNALQDLNLYINDSTPNQKIRDKIKELEREKRILEDNKMKDKMVYTPYQIVDAEILRLKELLEGE